MNIMGRRHQSGRGGVAKKKESYRSLSKKKIELCAFDFHDVIV